MMKLKLVGPTLWYVVQIQDRLSYKIGDTWLIGKLYCLKHKTSCCVWSQDIHQTGCNWYVQKEVSLILAKLFWGSFAKFHVNQVLVMLIRGKWPQMVDPAVSSETKCFMLKRMRIVYFSDDLYMCASENLFFFNCLTQYNQNVYWAKTHFFHTFSVTGSKLPQTMSSTATSLLSGFCVFVMATIIVLDRVHI